METVRIYKGYYIPTWQEVYDSIDTTQMYSPRVPVKIQNMDDESKSFNFLIDFMIVAKEGDEDVASQRIWDMVTEFIDRKE